MARPVRHGILRVLGLCVLGALASEAAAPRTLELEADRRGLPRLSQTAPTNQVVVLERSADLAGWSEIARIHGGPARFPDLAARELPRAFYRSYVRSLTGQDDWKNQLGGFDEPFRSPAPPYGRRESRWVKFVLLLDEPQRVFFQDSAKYAFHYDFARVRIPRFAGLTRAQFDQATLRRAGQQAVLGAVVLPPTTEIVEVGLQLVGLEAYPREAVAGWLETVRACLVLPAGTSVYYLPTFEQAGVARENVAWFADRGLPVSSADRWILGDECYAAGWALGRLVFVPAAQIGAAYRAGTLRPEDILLTEAVPAEVPPVAGIVALAPATPNSHVALLAQSFGIPFVYPAEATVRDALPALHGREVVLRARDLFGGCELLLEPLASPLPEVERAAILAVRALPPLALTPKAVFGGFSVSAEGLRPGDLRYVGGKAAHFGLVRRALPTNSPAPALAFTFDLWDAYLEQTLAGGTTLRAAIAQRLGGFAWPPDMVALQTALAQVRQLMTDEADFSAAQRAAILGALEGAGLDSTRKIRFRSSTNVEDTDQFNGAGLYDSYSGCLADELDGDTRGPSACDPAEPGERGVFRALRKVYASFYNENAFLERVRHGVDAAAVGMAVLVHPSTPDAYELANGVATLSIYKGTAPADRGVSATLVTQAGAVSVANPDSTARPERVSGSSWAGGAPFLEVESRSSLVPLGATVLAWETEYRQLFVLLDAAARAYEAEFPAPRQLLLDFEYKKVEPGWLLVKQIRTVPRPDTTAKVVPWLLDTAPRYGVFQGEFGDLIANHRLKSWWTFGLRHARLVATNLSGSLFARLEGEWWDGTNRVRRAGPPAALPGYRFARTAEGTLDGWTEEGGGESRTCELRTYLTTPVAASSGPLTVLGDHRLEWTVHYATPQPTLGYEPRFTTTRSESVWLGPVRPVTAESLRQTRVFKRGAWQVDTTFYWPPPPKGIVAGYTAPLQAWVETTLTGLTSRPIVLRSEGAQTYRPGHHNFTEDFAFEPRLEPGLAAGMLAELAAQNIRALIVSSDAFGAPQMLIWGLDGKFRLP